MPLPIAHGNHRHLRGSFIDTTQEISTCKTPGTGSAGGTAVASTESIACGTASENGKNEVNADARRGVSASSSGDKG